MKKSGAAPDADRARIEQALEQKRAKPRIHMLTPEMMLAGLPAAEFGAQKYAPWAWLQMAKKGDMSFVSLLDAAMRHLIAYTHGEDTDQESGINHLHHAACDVGFLLTMVERGLVANDDRPTTPTFITIKFGDELVQPDNDKPLENWIRG